MMEQEWTIESHPALDYQRPQTSKRDEGVQPCARKTLTLRLAITDQSS